MRWIGPVTPGSSNVILYGTIDEVTAQIEELKLHPEGTWHLTTEIEARSILPGIAPRGDGSFKRTRTGIDCNNARGTVTAYFALEVVYAIAHNGGACGSRAEAIHSLLFYGSR